MAILINSSTDDGDKNFWATTWQCFLDAQALYGREFAVDVAAEPQTAKVARYYARPELMDMVLDYRTGYETRRILAHWDDIGVSCVGLDSLNLIWPEDWWCNPPFDDKERFIRKARIEQEAGRPGMMLLPYEKLTQWWRRNLSQDCIIYEPDGRYNFNERDGVTTKKGVNFGSVLIAFPAQKIGKSIDVPFERGFSAKLNKAPNNNKPALVSTGPFYEVAT